MSMPDEDVDMIRNHGVPISPGTELLEIDSNGSVTFTLRGKNLYRLAMLLNGLSPDLIESVRTRDDLREVSLKVKQVRVMLAADAAERALNSGKIPVKAREMVAAVIHGTPKDLHAAMERRLACAAAGSNVFPVAFGRKNTAA